MIADTASFAPDRAFSLLRDALVHSTPAPYVPDEVLVDASMRAFLESREVDGLLPRLGLAPGPWAEIHRDVWNRQLSALVEFVDGLLAAGVRPVVFKGVELISRYFPDAPLGFLVDADVLVDRRDIQATKKVLYELGYTQSYFDTNAGELVDRDVRDLGELEATHYELGPFCKTVSIELDGGAVSLVATRNAHPLYVVGDHCLAVLEMDVHHSVASDVDPAPLLDRAVASTCCSGLTLAPTDHLWVNCSRFYNEVALFGKRSLRPLVYTAPLLRDESIDWDVLVATARDLELSASLYYPLRTLEALTATEVPIKVLDAVDPRGAIRDFGWQLGPLFRLVDQFPFASGESGR